MKNFLLASAVVVALAIPMSAQNDRPGQRFTTEQAIQSCQDSIRHEASERFGNANVVFRQTIPDNNPGRKDWVTGVIAVKTSRWRPSETYRFSCSVDFESGRLRTAHIGTPSY
jgi:hypothetical protein